MDIIGVPPRGGTTDPGAAGFGPRALAEADLADARARLEGAERKAKRHLTWSVLGLSPAALVPFVAFLAEGSVALLAALLVMVPLVELVRWRRAKRHARRLRALVDRLADDHPDTTASEGVDQA